MEEKIKARSVPFAQTRNHHANETAEDYVEAVAEIIEESGGAIFAHGPKMDSQDFER